MSLALKWCLWTIPPACQSSSFSSICLPFSRICLYGQLFCLYGSHIAPSVSESCVLCAYLHVCVSGGGAERGPPRARRCTRCLPHVTHPHLQGPVMAVWLLVLLPFYRGRNRGSKKLRIHLTTHDNKNNPSNRPRIVTGYQLPSASTHSTHSLNTFISAEDGRSSVNLSEL